MNHGCTAHTELLIELLAKIAVQKGCMESIPIATEEQDVRYEKIESGMIRYEAYAQICMMDK